jgi:hypothetical protein
VTSVKSKPEAAEEEGLHGGEQTRSGKKKRRGVTRWGANQKRQKKKKKRGYTRSGEEEEEGLHQKRPGSKVRRSK